MRRAWILTLISLCGVSAGWTAGGAIVKADYLRVWEKRGGAWKLRADCLAEAPVPQPEKPKT